MSYLNKEYVSPSGTDFTKWVNTEEDFKLFEEMCALERQCDRPLNECYKEVAAALNIGRKLQGIKAKVLIQGDPNLN